MSRAQQSAAPPAGLVHVPDLLTPEQHDDAVAGLERLEMHELRMRGQLARRTVRHFGWDYGYDSWTLVPAEPLPGFLEPLRAAAAAVAGLDQAALEQALVTSYPPGATIGWHRDAPMFGTVAGISLLAACRMRFQRGTGPDREVYEIALEPRSGYVLAGEARTRWQHSIPAVKEPRWSVTFRTLRNPGRWRRELPAGGV
ncbi:MAG TPA: alpha-ketoglutarate-dependent dioxygenase AlkB [Gaiellales bacterium]|jgi:alkylated DNA repair dioxygenase AlkB